MKKYFKEIAILIAQLLMFYVFPLTAGPTDAMGMVFLIIVATFVLAIIMGSVSKKKPSMCIRFWFLFFLFLPFSSIIMILHSYTPFGIW